MNKQASIYWFTGLSGAGKTTIANTVKNLCELNGKTVKILDGDDIRNQFNSHLGFNEADIKKNNEFAIELCQSFQYDVDIILVPIISPYADSRALAREALGKDYVEVYVDADIKTLEKRDTKGLYHKAKHGDIDNLIGYSDGTTYEAPKNPEIHVHTEVQSVLESANVVFDHIQNILQPSYS